MADPTDDQRWKAFDTCRSAYLDKWDQGVIDTAIAAVTGDYIKAGIEFFGTVTVAHEADCAKFLTPEQLHQWAEQMRELHDRIRQNPNSA